MSDQTTPDERADELFKLATQKKKEKDWEGAINTLNEAYREISQSHLNYSIESFIRLPQFLQLAGRSKEAWQKYNELLFNGFPTQLQNRSTLPMERSILFDKMRLHLQREKKEQLAEIFSILSAVSWRVGLQRQERFDELASRSSGDGVTVMISTLTSYQTPGIIKQLCEAVTDELRRFPAVDYDRMGSAMEAIISNAKPT